MSSLLEQAIIDAKMLKETARKNAEAQILEERAEEIKRKIEMLFEEEDPLAGLGGDAATAPATMSAAPAAEPTPEVKKTMDKIPPSYLGESESNEIEINLDSLIQKVTKLEEEVAPHGDVPNMPVGDQIEEGDTYEDVAEDLEESVEGDKKREAAAADKKKAADMMAAAATKTAGAAADDKREREADERQAKKAGTTATASDTSVEETEIYEEFTLDEEALDEKMVVDMENVEKGGHNNFIELKRQKDVEKALEAQGQLEEENAELSEALVQKANEAAELEEQLNAAIAKLQETKEKLKKSVSLNVQLKEGVQMLTQKVGEVNLLNARLLYTNKTLGNSSLNERQKKQIAEAVSGAKSVEEAKTIYETLQRSVGEGVEKRSAPQSLTEALNKSPAPFLPRRQPTVDPVATRWQIIAGIKK